MFVERIKTIEKNIMMNEKKKPNYKKCSKTMVFFEEKKTYIYLTMAYITSKTVLLLADIAIFSCTFGRIII